MQNLHYRNLCDRCCIDNISCSYDNHKEEFMTLITQSSADLSEDEKLPALATPSQVHTYTGIPTSTLAFWRYEGSHLPFVKMGRLIRYRRQDVLGFIQSNVYSSTAEAKAAE